MHKYMKNIILILLMTLSSVAFADSADDLKFIDGIWQFAGHTPFDPLEPEENSEKFYSLHYDGNTLVLVDFESMKFSGDSFAATFLGEQEKTREFILEPLRYVPHPQFPSMNLKHKSRVTFISDTEAVLSPIFESPIADGMSIKIRKIFK